MEKYVVSSDKDVMECLAQQIQKRSAETEEFRVGLSGGSMIGYVAKALCLIDIDLTKWKFFFCDERFVPLDDPESTFGAYRRLLVAQTGIRDDQFVTINANCTLSECAKDYDEKITKEFQMELGSIPIFDILFLGMGPDGHTCSLFPGHAALEEKRSIIVPISDSPKPPRRRITMTFPLINNSRCCMFAMCGAEKAEMAKRVFVDRDQSLPAARVAPKYGPLICIFDEEAGKYIK